MGEVAKRGAAGTGGEVALVRRWGWAINAGEDLPRSW